MKKIIILLYIFIFSLNGVSAEYSLSASDEAKVDQAVVLINNFIEKNGESVREKLLIKIDQILARPNLSEKNIAIFTRLSDGLQVTTEDSMIEKLITEIDKTIEEISDTDFTFSFSDSANRCSANPCETTENFVKIEGKVDNSQIKYVEVNDYRLSSYEGSTWEYNPNIAYNNFSEGENIYVINYLGDDSEVLFTENFVINKLIPEVVEDPETTSFANTTELENESSVTAETIEEEQIVSSPSYSIESDIPYVDEDEVREYWRGLLNKERTLLGLDDYTYDKSLDATAKIWSDMAVSRGYIDHKVDSPSDSYYDYWKKAEWMEDNGVVCENVSRATFSESIAWNNYYCSDTSTCTDQLKAAVKRTYDFYMSEKGTDYDPHYRAIAHVNFETMGLGLSTVDLGNGGYRMYLTNHYCTTNTK